MPDRRPGSMLAAVLRYRTARIVRSGDRMKFACDLSATL